MQAENRDTAEQFFRIAIFAKHNSTVHSEFNKYNKNEYRNTVKPPNSGHLRVSTKVSAFRRCPLYRDFSKNRNFVRFWLLYSI